MKVRRGSHADEILAEIHEYGIYLERREVWYHGYICDSGHESDPGVEYRSINMFIKNLRYLDATTEKPILIHFNSTGGDWYYGMGAYNAIENCESLVIILMYGPCMSMGSIIPLAADKVVVMPDTTLMIHDGTTDISDDMTAKQGQSWAELERVNQDRMLEIYTKARRS